MVRAHSRRTKRRFEKAVDNRSDEEREAAADKIVQELMSSENSAITKNNMLIKTASWEDGPMRRSVPEDEKLKTLQVCENCLRLMGIQGIHRWAGGVECDICEEEGWCNIFYHDETMVQGDVYENDTGDWPDDISQIPFSNDWPEELVCTACGHIASSTTMEPGYLCQVSKCMGVYEYKPVNKKQTKTDKPMLVCDFCGTNWMETWGLWCEKCSSGKRMLQTIPEISGKTEKVCEFCLSPWAESDESTTCSKCGKGKVLYRAVHLPTDVPRRQSENEIKVEDMLKKPRRIWVPDYTGPRAANGNVKLIEKKETIPSEDDLYSVNGS